MAVDTDKLLADIQALPEEERLGIYFNLSRPFAHPAGGMMLIAVEHQKIAHRVSGAMFGGSFKTCSNF